MYKLRQTRFFFYKLRAGYRKLWRKYFPSPAEVELIRIMGGNYISFSHIKDPATGFPLTIVTDLGSILKRELIQREVRVGAMYIDFGVANKYYRRGIEVDGAAHHKNILKEIERDEYLEGYGWRVLHIQAAQIYRNPTFVQQRILSFLAS